LAASTVSWPALFATATQWLGVPYLYGGVTALGFDCSGFTQAVYQAATGTNIGRDTTAQFKSGTPVGVDGNWAADLPLLKPGDLIFYGAPGASGPNAHVVMYAGGNQVIQAGGKNVNITTLFASASPSDPFLGVRRYVNVTGGPGGGATGGSVSGPAGNTTAPSGGTSQSWEAALLEAIGAPVNATNLTALALWTQAEGTSGSNNPLAVGGTGPGATSCLAQCGSSTPIMAYDTMADGIAQTAKDLQSPSFGYPAIVTAFQSTTDNNSQPSQQGLATIWASINASSWCSGCDGGTYPNTLHNVLGSTPAQLTSLWGSIGQAIGSGVGNVLGPVGSTLGGAAGGVVGGFANLDKFFGDITSAKFWDRVLLFAGGGVLAGVGLIVFLSTTSAGKTVESSAAQGAALAAVA
jgi:cell wall-associated NlpC family hydrolase